MPSPIIPISYNDLSDDDLSGENIYEPVIRYSDSVRPSEIIRSTKNYNSSDTDSDDENPILASICEQREREKKTPAAIRRSLTSFSNRIRILPEPVRNTYTNTNVNEETTCSKLKPAIGLTTTIIIAIGCIIAV